MELRWEDCGSIIYKRNKERREEQSKGGGREIQDTKDGKSPPPPTTVGVKSQCAVWVRTGGCRGRAQGPSLLHSSYPPFWRSCSLSLGQCGSCSASQAVLCGREISGFRHSSLGSNSNSVTEQTAQRPWAGWVLISQSISPFICNDLFSEVC